MARPEMSPVATIITSVLILAGTGGGFYRMHAGSDGATVTRTATIIGCSPLAARKGPPAIAIRLDVAPYEVRFDQPKDFFYGVQATCQAAAPISFTATPAKNIFGEALWLRSLRREDTHSNVFSETDYADWESSNNRLGTVVLGLFALVGVFGIFAGLKRARETR